MSQYHVEFIRVTTGGPFAYALSRNGTGVKAAVGLPTVAAVLNAARDDIAALMDPGEAVQRGTLEVESKVP